MIGLAGGCLAQKDGGNFPSYCWDKQAWMVAIEKCYTDQGLKMPMPPKDGADGKNRRDASLEQGGKTDQDWAGAKDGNWSKPDGDWGKDEVKATSASGVTATKDGVTWVVNKDGAWVKLESLGRRDLDKDVDWNKDGNWSKPAGNYSKDEVKATSAPGVTATKDGVTWVVNKDGVWVKLESLGRRDGSWDAWLAGKDGNWTKPAGNWSKDGDWSKPSANASKETWAAWLSGAKEHLGRRDMTSASGPDNYCANRAAYDAASTCTLNLERACTPPEYMSLLPDPNNMITAGNVICNNQKDIDHLCNLNNTDDMAACQKAKYGQLTVAEANDPVLASCAMFDHIEQCLEEEIQECGQANLDIQKQLNSLAKPPACANQAIGK